MSPYDRFNSLLVGVTVVAMVIAIGYIAPLIRDAETGYKIAAPLVGLLTSAGIYRLLSLGVRWLLERFEPLRQYVLGPNYVHGTWIGWFRGHGGEVRVMVEHFSQDLDSLVITGRSYDAAGASHGYWSSDAVSLDSRKGELRFTYTFEAVNRSAPLFGVHKSLLERESPRDAPTAYSGLAHDLNDAVRIPVHAEKISRDLVSWEDGSRKALKRWKDLAKG